MNPPEPDRPEIILFREGVLRDCAILAFQAHSPHPGARDPFPIPVQGGGRIHGQPFVGEKWDSCLSQAQKREQYLSPIFQCSVNPADLKSPRVVVNLHLLVTAPALEQIPRGFPPHPLPVIHPDLRNTEP